MQKWGGGRRGGGRRGQQLAGPGTWGATEPGVGQSLRAGAGPQEGRGWWSKMRPRRRNPVSSGMLPPMGPEPRAPSGTAAMGPTSQEWKQGGSHPPASASVGASLLDTQQKAGCERPGAAPTPPVLEPEGGDPAVTEVPPGPSPVSGGFLGLFGLRGTTPTSLSSSVGVSRQAGGCL